MTKNVFAQKFSHFHSNLRDFILEEPNKSSAELQEQIKLVNVLQVQFFETLCTKLETFNDGDSERIDLLRLAVQVAHWDIVIKFRQVALVAD